MNAVKSLYRNPDDKRIAGVCSGIADYFGIENWLARVLTVTAFFLLAGPF
ncbi:MAG: PspC domain-containing protein, partial [Glaciecola sp.]